MGQLVQSLINKLHASCTVAQKQNLDDIHYNTLQYDQTNFYFPCFSRKFFLYRRHHFWVKSSTRSVYAVCTANEHTQCSDLIICFSHFYWLLVIALGNWQVDLCHSLLGTLSFMTTIYQSLFVRKKKTGKILNNLGSETSVARQPLFWNN